MQKGSIQELTYLLKVIGWLIGGIGSIVVLCGGLVGYIWSTFRRQNHGEHRKLFDKTDEHETRISHIEGAHEK